MRELWLRLLFSRFAKICFSESVRSTPSCIRINNQQLISAFGMRFVLCVIYGVLLTYSTCTSIAFQSIVAIAVNQTKR